MLARPGLPEFDYIRAESSQEVFDLLKEKGEDLKFLLGGTDLFIQMRDCDQAPGTILDLKGLPGMGEINYHKKNGLEVGAAVTFNQLSSHKDLQKAYPILCQAADTIGNYQLRNRATLGGNICNASPSADLAPALLVYQAEVVLESPRGERMLAVEEFWTGPGKTVLEPDEFLSAVRFPRPPAGARGVYLKLGRNKMGDLAIVGVAVLGYPDKEIPAGIRFRISLNSTAPVPYRVPAVEEYLTQAPITEEILSEAAQGARDISAPIEDVRATALYQKKMVRNLTYKALRDIWESFR